MDDKLTPITRRHLIGGVVAVAATTVPGALTGARPVSAAAVVGGQAQWYWCHKCSGLHFPTDADAGICPAGGGHEHIGSWDYYLPCNVAPTSGSWQNRWRYCRRCRGLFYGPPLANACAAGSWHDGTGSFDYYVATAPLPADWAPHIQGGWRWCRWCMGLFYGGGAGRCPATHADHDPTGSGSYVLMGY